MIHIAMDFMNGGKTKDWYYFQLQNLSSFDDEVDLDAVNACIKGAKVSASHAYYYELLKRIIDVSN